MTDQISITVAARLAAVALALVAFVVLTVTLARSMGGGFAGGAVALLLVASLVLLVAHVVTTPAPRKPGPDIKEVAARLWASIPDERQPVA